MLEPLIEVHMAAFKGYLNTRMGPEYVRQFLEWYRSDPDSIALAALVDNIPVGYVVGSPLGYQRRMNRDLLFVVAKAVACRPWILLSKRFSRAILLRFENLCGIGASDQVPSLTFPCVSLVGICTSPEARGKKVGAMLMTAFEIQARKKGMRSMRLSVYETNHAARALYEKMGWESLPSEGSGTVYYAKSVNVP